MARGQRCILYKLKQRWLEAVLPTQTDKNIIAKMKVVYKEYNNARQQALTPLVQRMKPDLAGKILVLPIL